MFLAKLVDVGMAIDLDIVLGLDNINAIEHIQKALPFDGHGELFVKHVKENVQCTLVGGGDGKVVNLARQNDAFAINEARVQARLVDSWGQSELTQHCICVFLPEAGDSGWPCIAERTGMTWPGGMGGWPLWFPHKSLKAQSGRMKKPPLGGGALAKALQTTEPKTRRFLAAAMA